MRKLILIAGAAIATTAMPAFAGGIYGLGTGHVTSAQGTIIDNGAGAGGSPLGGSGGSTSSGGGGSTSSGGGGSTSSGGASVLGDGIACTVCSLAHTVSGATGGISSGNMVSNLVSVTLGGKSAYHGSSLVSVDVGGKGKKHGRVASVGVGTASHGHSGALVSVNVLGGKANHGSLVRVSALDNRSSLVKVSALGRGKGYGAAIKVGAPAVNLGKTAGSLIGATGVDCLPGVAGTQAVRTKALNLASLRGASLLRVRVGH